MAETPRDPSLDATLALVREGANFIRNRCAELDSDVFRTRLMLQEVICMRGEEAAQLLYDGERFKREGAAPGIARKTLFGEGGVQGLDGEAHRHRKAMFMALMEPDSIDRIERIADEHWARYIDRWTREDQPVAVFEQSNRLLCEAVCQWAGVPLADAEVEGRTDDFLALIQAPASVGLTQWRGRRARARLEVWLAHVVEGVRAGELIPPPAAALRIIAEHRDLEGHLLAPRIAAVELLNVLRPTVAIGRWFTFAALALHEYPQYRDRLRGAEEAEVVCFVHETRRFYPFFPFVGAIVRNDFNWKGYHFPEGKRVLLDLYGTNHHTATWQDPDRFRPERFREWNDDGFSFIPQGGGDYYTHHRCPGEWITVALMKGAVRQLIDVIEYDVPEQDLEIDPSELPAKPQSGFLINNVRPR